MYDMFEKINWVDDRPNTYPIKICLANDKYNIEGEVQFILRPDDFGFLNLHYYCPPSLKFA